MINTVNSTDVNYTMITDNPEKNVVVFRLGLM